MKKRIRVSTLDFFLDKYTLLWLESYLYVLCTDEMREGILVVPQAMGPLYLSNA